MVRKKKPSPVVILTVIAAVLLVGIGVWWVFFEGRRSTDNAYLKSNVTLLSPKVTGYVTEVLVKDNQRVKAGDVLIKIDPKDYEARLEQAEASAAALTNQMTSQQSLIEQAQANATKARKDLARARALVPEGAISQKRLDDAQAAFTATNAAYSANKAQLDALTSQQKQAEATVKLAQIDLSNTTIIAPAEGTIGSRSAQVGQLVRPGSALMYLIPDEIWVEANFKETQLPGMVPGKPATIKVDALGDKPMKGHVVSLAPASGSEFSLLPPENATGNFTKIVRRVPVRVEFDNLASLPETVRAGLKPGLSSVVTVDVR
jgi:membrane fusion protein (multidrug efflux system)